MEFNGSRDALAAKLIRHKGPFANVSMWPCGIEPLRKLGNCAPPDKGGWFFCLFWRNGETFIWRTQMGVYQYVLIKSIMTIGFFIASLSGKLGEYDDYSHFALYYYWILLASQVWAICCLVLFFEATLTFMWPLKPFLKFVSVKGLVFVTWAQGLFISWLNSNGYVSGYEDMSKDEVAASLQDFVVCVEMLLLAYMHHVAFNVHEFWHPLRGALGNLSPEEAATPRVKLTLRVVAAALIPVADLHRDAAKAVGALKPRHPVSGEDKGPGVAAADATVLCVPSARVAPVAAAPPAASAKVAPQPEAT